MLPFVSQRLVSLVLPQKCKALITDREVPGRKTAPNSRMTSLQSNLWGACPEQVKGLVWGFLPHLENHPFYRNVESNLRDGEQEKAATEMFSAFLVL